MSQLKIGFSKININPPLGSAIFGYYVPRYAKGFLDDLEARTLVLEYGGNKYVIISIDNCAIPAYMVKDFCLKISTETGFCKNNIIINATHIHTGPFMQKSSMFDVSEEEIKSYVKFLSQKLVDGVIMANADLTPGKVGYIVGEAPERVSYIRRYRMKDGTTMTCPPLDNFNIDYPLGELDRRVNVLRFDKENANSIVIVNYGVHADTIGGEYFSADFPHWLRETLYKALDGVECMFIPGAQGDVGSTNINPKDGDMNDTEISFDNEMKSPGMARFVGRALAGTVLQVYDKVKYIDIDDVKILSKLVRISANLPNPEDLPLAHKYIALHDAGRDDEIPFCGMELTTVVAEAARMVNLENAPEYFEFELICLKIGEIAIVGIPGEPFTDIGVEIKKCDGWGIILPCAVTNGCEGYFPVKSAYDEGGYEARSSPFKSDVAELIIDGAKSLLEDIKN